MISTVIALCFVIVILCTLCRFLYSSHLVSSLRLFSCFSSPQSSPCRASPSPRLTTHLFFALDSQLFLSFSSLFWYWAVFCEGWQESLTFQTLIFLHQELLEAWVGVLLLLLLLLVQGTAGHTWQDQLLTSRTGSSNSPLAHCDRHNLPSFTLSTLFNL